MQQGDQRIPLLLTCSFKITPIFFFRNLFLQFILFQVSWLRRRPGQDVPLLLTFGETVYVSDVRFSIRRSNEDWILDILHAKTEDEAIYECQVSTEPPKIHKIFLAVEGKNQKT